MWQVSSAMEETATLSNVLAIGSGFVLEALEKKSVQLASSMLTQMVGILYTAHSRAASFQHCVVLSCNSILCVIFAVHGCKMLPKAYLFQHHSQRA